MVLVFLGALHPEFLKTRSNMINSSTVKSVEDIYHFLCKIALSESQNPAIIETQERSALAVHGRRARGRGRGSDFGARDYGSGRSAERAREVIYCYYCKE